MEPDDGPIRHVFTSQLGGRMVSMSSTLVETVSINYEDFNESFLTCGTCLCVYDGSEHTPKLLPCSHTVCLHCLGRIAASQTRDTGSFRCPICRELISIPRGGVPALPPSFLVNQLLDLMSRQRREVVPKCSDHINQELLFCETCDTVFCTVCTAGSHSGAGPSPSCEHTIIPFSIAIKRMSEILLYRANECIAKLAGAHDAVSQELRRLDLAADRCREEVNKTFQEVSELVESRRQELLGSVGDACQAKRRVLEEQLALIDGEKAKVEGECEGLQYQVEVRNITQRIASLSEKLDAAGTLSDPRENAFLAAELSEGPGLGGVGASLARLGRVRTSTTFPGLCTATVGGPVVARLECATEVRTVDYHGNARTAGGDPVEAEAFREGASGSPERVPTEVDDLGDGTYRVRFRPPGPSRYSLAISVFGRPIRDSPMAVDASEHNDPVATFGRRGSGKDEFLQPVAVAVDPSDGLVYVADAGNSRVKVLDEELRFVRHLENEGLLGRSCTGLAVSARGLVAVNWRTRTVTEMSRDGGDTVASFTHPGFQEPIDVAVDPEYGHVLVADNGSGCVFVFDADGKFLFQVGKKGSQKGCFNLISAVTVGPGGEIVVADSRVQVFSSKGDFLEELYAEGKGRGRYGGVAVDPEGRVVATRSEKSRNLVQVLRLGGGAAPPLATIDSDSARLKRPSGVAVTSGRHAVVVDLGNDCIKKYRYW